MNAIIDSPAQGPHPRCPLCEHDHEPIQRHPRVTQTFGPFRISEDDHFECLSVAEDPMRFSELERECLSSALLKGFIVDRTRRPGDYGRTRISQQWRCWCEILRIPYIQFLPRKLYSVANFSLEPTNSFLPPEHRKALCVLLDSHEHRKPNKNARGPEVFSAEIPVGAIETIAGILIKYAIKHSESVKPAQ